MPSPTRSSAPAATAAATVRRVSPSSVSRSASGARNGVRSSSRRTSSTAAWTGGGRVGRASAPPYSRP
ncbi:hypothetical protein [Streptomyces javensis]|uniref:hypothetical protein n=1 Tax=Streptomyces javensis TaxID=114698 RepID=UPI001FE99B48|nr:hypothetical protein [Streptomyces javensis]